MNIEAIAHIRTDLPTKFGVPRQSGLIEELKGRIIFEPPYRDPQAVKGLEGFERIWLLWDFHLAHRENHAMTVCPPRLGGRVHMGVFATRSPFRPNSIGLSCVRLLLVEHTQEGPVLTVSGIDMADMTPIYDIKPYIPDYDSFPSSKAGFTETHSFRPLKVEDPLHLMEKNALSEDQKNALGSILSSDPRPRYDLTNAPAERVYGFFYLDMDVRFKVSGDVLTLTEIVRPVS